MREGRFVNATNFYNLNLGGAKDGGLTWADFNNDGNIDVLVNTTNTTNDSRLYFADAAGLLTFTDVTTTNASGLLDNNCRRTAIAADLNNDGYVDFLRNYFDRIEIYYNKGPNSNPAYSFGTGTQDPNIVITAITGGMNTEGIGFIDWNSDGYLDIVVDNDNNGTEIYENDKDGTFTLQTPGHRCWSTRLPPHPLVTMVITWLWQITTTTATPTSSFGKMQPMPTELIFGSTTQQQVDMMELPLPTSQQMAETKGQSPFAISTTTQIWI